MQLPVHTCAFKGGMNKDLSPNDYPNVCYYDAENLRVVVDNSEGMTSSSMSTPKGTLASFSLPADNVLLGYAVLRDYLVILAKDTLDTTYPDRIYKILISEIIDTISIPVTLSESYVKDGGDLVYRADLGFDLNYPIRVVANYENASVQKIYWVDGINTLKHLNIIYDETYNDLVYLDPQLLEILPNHTYGTYELEETIGGHLRAGRIQYSYQLYSVSGTETMFAPPSNLYNLTNSVLADDIEFVGSELEDEINKAIRVTITLPTDVDDIFDRIRLVALTYEEYNDTPTVRVVSEQPLTTNIVTITDYGNSIGELVLEEFQVIKNDLVPATIESKNNYLFAANLEEQFFDIDETVEDLGVGKTFLDTRAYRWKYSTTGATVSGSTTLDSVSDPEAIANSQGFPAGISWSLLDATITAATWEIMIQVGAPQHATDAGKTFTGISTINSTYLELWLRNASSGEWAMVGLDMSGTSFYTGLAGGGTVPLTISGTSYMPGDGSYDIDPTCPVNPLGWGSTYDRVCILMLDYIYTYTEVLAGPSSFQCVLNEGGVGSSPILIVDSSDFDAVPEDHDCINVYNNIENDEAAGSEYKYKSTLAGAVPIIGDLGGTGPYLSYNFTYEDFVVAESETVTFGTGGDTASTRILYGKSTNPGYKDPQKVVDYTGYQRGEVYRFGIVFYDLKGRPSFTKWIGDIRFPNPSEELNPGTTWSDQYALNTNTTLLLSATSMRARALGVQFTINWDDIDTDYPGLLEQLSGFQIVRTPRTSNDCTIKAQGLILPTHLPDTPALELLDANYSTYNITSAKDYLDDTFQLVTNITALNSTMTKDLVELISPEIAINKNLRIDRSTDFLEIYGRLAYMQNAGGDQIESPAASGEYYDIYGVTASCVAAYDAENAHIATHWRRDVDDAFISTPEKRTGVIHMLDGVPFVSRGYDGEAAAVSEIAFKGTTLVAKIDSEFTNTNKNCGVFTTLAANGLEEAMYGRYRRYLGYSQYGGATYVERSYNQYIKASEFNSIPDPVAATTYTVYNGDVYICPFNFMKLFADTDAEVLDHTGQVIVSFPVESRINVAYLLNSTADIYVDSAATEGKYFIAEKQSIGVSQYPNGYPECGDLYRYNSAYSAEDVSKVFPTKPFDFRSSVQKDVMVTSSDPKINGEYSDSWLKFKFNNYIELEGEYGAITRIINNNDRLMAFQPRGMAVLSVAERELVQTNNTAALAVGSGSILSRYDYISKTVGTSFYDAICPTELGIYFYSDKLHSIYRLTEGLEALSDTKGMKSYFEGTPWTACLTAYDKANREILFTPMIGTTPQKTLVFSGYIDAFSSFYTLGLDATAYDVYSYITFDKYLISSNDNGNSYYLHNFGNWSEYYGVDQTSTLSLIVNPAKTNVVTYHVAEWITDLIDNDGNEIPNLTFDELQITNTYQDTDIIDISTYPDIKKRFRKWRLNTFRGSDKGRIRDSWIKAVFTFYQTHYNRKLVVHPINFMYTPTKLW